MATSTGAKLLAETLAREGVERVWRAGAVSLGDAAKALARAGIDVVGAPAEGGAVAMAAGEARRTGRPAVVLLPEGAGLLAGSAALVQAREDGLPLLAIVFARAASTSSPPELQGVQDVALPTKPEHLPDDVAVMLRRAREEGPCPMAVVVAEDAIAMQALRDARPAPSRPPGAARDPEHTAKMDRIFRLLRQAKRVGLHLGSAAAAVHGPLGELAERLQAPVSTTAAARGVIAESHPLSVGFGFAPGTPAWAARILAGCDFVIAIGTRSMADRQAPLDPTPARLVLVDELAPYPAAGKPDVALVDHPRAFVAALLDRLDQVPRDERLRARIAKGKRKQAAGLSRDLREDGVQPELLLARLRSRLPPDGLLVLDGGHVAAWARYAFPVDLPGTLLAPPDGTSRRAAIPLALGALVARADRPALCITSDDGVAACAPELRLASARRVALPVLVTEEIHGRDRDGRLPALDLRALAQAFGARAVAIDSDFDLDRGLDAALSSGDRPTLCRVRLVADRLPSHQRTAAGKVRHAAASVARRLIQRG